VKTPEIQRAMFMVLSGYKKTFLHLVVKYKIFVAVYMSLGYIVIVYLPVAFPLITS